MRTTAWHIYFTARTWLSISGLGIVSACSRCVSRVRPGAQQPGSVEPGSCILCSKCTSKHTSTHAGHQLRCIGKRDRGKKPSSRVDRGRSGENAIGCLRAHRDSQRGAPAAVPSGTCASGARTVRCCVVTPDCGTPVPVPVAEVRVPVPVAAGSVSLLLLNTPLILSAIVILADLAFFAVR